MGRETSQMPSVNNRQFRSSGESMHVPHDKTVTTQGVLFGAVAHRPRGAQLVGVIRDASLPGVLAEEIEQMIVSGQLRPGDHVNELQLAQRYGVSRGPLRAALGTLTAQGLLEQFKNRGSFVRRVGSREVGEIYQFRGILELAAIDAFATLDLHARQRILERLADVLLEMKEAVSAADHRRYFSLNLMFHETLISAHGNSKMLNTYRGLVRDLVLVRRQKLHSAASIARSLQEHHNIVEALTERDVSGARQQLIAHMEQGRKRTVKFEEPQ
jgi:DNA-binding GntR family transcriptional regulator